jgi:hypothetical protein
MYCLSTTQGSDFNIWPRRALNRDVREKKKSIKDSNVQMEEEDLAAVLTQLTQAGKLQVDKPDDLAEAHRAALRRLVMRGPPHHYVVDRRSVWRLFIVEAPSDTSSMTVGEISAARVMKQAKDVLAASSSHRAGSHVYEMKRRRKLGANAKDGTSTIISSLEGGESVAGNWRINAIPGDGVALPQSITSVQGGEKFPQALQQIQNKMAFRMEAQLLEDRRVKEAYIANYMTHAVAADMDAESTIMMKKGEAQRRKFRQHQQRRRGTDGCGDDSSFAEGSIGQMSLMTEENSFMPGGDGSVAPPVEFEADQSLMLDLDDTSQRAYGGQLIGLHTQFARISRQTELQQKAARESIAPTMAITPHADEEETGENRLKHKRFLERLAKFKLMDDHMQNSLVYKNHIDKVAKISNILS